MPLLLLANWRWIAEIAGIVILGSLLGLSRLEVAHIKLSVANQKIEAQQKLAVANAKTESIINSIHTMTRKVEANYADNRIANDAAYARGLAIGRVWIDKGGRCRAGGDNQMSNNRGPASVPVEQTTGCELSSEARSFLWTLGHEADDAANRAQGGSDYAIGVKRAVNGP